MRSYANDVGTVCVCELDVTVGHLKNLARTILDFQELVVLPLDGVVRAPQHAHHMDTFGLGKARLWLIVGVGSFWAAPPPYRPDSAAGGLLLRLYRFEGPSA